MDDSVESSEWQSIYIRPDSVGWYDYCGWLLDPGLRLYWNGAQWGYWVDATLRLNWVHVAEMATDKWRGRL